jgi:hypothetical protein
LPQPKEVRAMIESIVLGILFMMILGYLFFAMLKPEVF